MPVKPSSSEDEYFARSEAELKKRLAAERQAKMVVEEREHAKQLHFMKCPKCGMQLEEVAFGEVKVDKCFNCGGLWLDDGELTTLVSKESGFFRRMVDLFR